MVAGRSVPRVLGYGGGVPSTALLVFAAEGRVDYPMAVMANGGEDSESPAKLRSVGEVTIPFAAWKGIEFHVLDRHRLDCMRIFADAGLPVPPRSSCLFCPFTEPSAWQDMARDEPALFDRSVELEETLNAGRQMLGRDLVYLSRFGMPLRDVFAGTQQQPLLPLVEDSACVGGWCHI